MKSGVSWGRRDHPRLRGEYSCSVGAVSGKRGSPPLARGIPAVGGGLITLYGITPACAGNTPEDETSGLPFKDHPRLRGEYFLAFSALGRS